MSGAEGNHGGAPAPVVLSSGVLTRNTPPCPEPGGNPPWLIRGEPFEPARAGAPAAQIAPLCLWGIVNVTPDSFHDGGSWAGTGAAVSHALRLASEGAAVLDVGGASSRPGAEDVPSEVEAARVLPVVSALAAHRVAASEGKASLAAFSGAAAGKGGGAGAFYLSVDTWRAGVAARALDAGADIVNDISACAWEPALREVVADKRPGYVLMHCQGRPGAMQDAPRYGNVLDEICAFFERGLTELVRAGLPESHVLLDPGIGFGKKLEHNLALLAGVERLQAFGRPLLLGVSHKSLFSALLGVAETDRGEATRVCTALMAARGILHHRVHDVAPARRALALVGMFGRGAECI